MTVTYTDQVATERLGGFFRLLFRWRGSIYSVIYGELSVFIVFYSFLSILYRHVLNATQKEYFERLCQYVNQFSDYVPVTFVLGFYVVRVISRRWTQWENVPWPDKISFNASIYIPGDDQRVRMLRRTLVRYVNLGSILCFRDICVPVKKRFPNMEYLVAAGLMTESEIELYNNVASVKDSNWWIPFHWAYTLMSRVKKEGKVADGYSQLLDDIMELRNKCWVLFSHDWIQIPMVYTQVATLSVYIFMFASAFGRQYLENKKDAPGSYKIDLYIPLFTILQLTFYLGWLKVAEVLISPMGQDADDFDVNYIIDRNLNLSYSVVDTNYNKLPPLEKDLHWGSGSETELPHTDESAGLRTQSFKGSAVDEAGDEQAQLARDAAATPGPDGLSSTKAYGGSAVALSTVPSQLSLSSRQPPPSPMSNRWRVFRRLVSVVSGGGSGDRRPPSGAAAAAAAAMTSSGDADGDFAAAKPSFIVGSSRQQSTRSTDEFEQARTSPLSGKKLNVDVLDSGVPIIARLTSICEHPEETDVEGTAGGSDAIESLPLLSPFRQISSSKENPR